MPTVDIRGVLAGVKNVAAFVFSSRVGLIVATATFLVATVSTFYTWFNGIRIPIVDVSSLGLDQDLLGNSGITDIFLYCVHADYVVMFVNWTITFINTFVPFMTTIIFTTLLFKFSMFLKHAIGSDIKQST